MDLPHLDKYFSFGCYFLLHWGIVQHLNLASIGQIFLIWMLFSVALGNCATSKFKVHNVLSNLDGSIIDSKFLFSQMEIQIKVNCHN